jgi:archaeosine synthase
VTDGFEVLDRDGPARLGELRLADPRTTPALIDDVLADSGSLWTAERDVPAGDPARLTVLPHRGHPAGTPDAVAEAFDSCPVDPEAVDGPTAAVISREAVTTCGADAYVLSGARALLGDARRFVETLTAVRDAIPDDAALYCPGVATPATVALCAYAGIDLFDDHAATISGTRREWLTRDGSYPVDDHEEVPRAAADVPHGSRRSDGGGPDGGTGSAAETDPPDAAACEAHNRRALRRELARVRERIREGTLRDYLAGQVRHHGWQTAALRRLDRHPFVAERTPIRRRATIRATADDALHRPAVRRFRERVGERYRPRFGRPIVLVPCAATKPYGESPSHGAFRNAVDFRAQLVTLTSPIGVVPMELEATYPAQQYDTPVTGHWSGEEVRVVGDALAAFLEGHRAAGAVPRVIAHVPAAYRPVCERAAAAADVEIEYTIPAADTSGGVAGVASGASATGPEDIDDQLHPTDEAALERLDGALDGGLRFGKGERLRNTVAAVADYQFGPDAADALVADTSVGGRFPRLQVRATDASATSAGDANGGDDQVAAMVPQDGLLALTLRGARRLVEAEAAPTVRIDDFVPHGSVLAPGITDADPHILPGDEVVIRGRSAFAVGRARMHGAAMVESTRGVAIDVRHVAER